MGEVDADSHTFFSSPYKSWLYTNKEMNDKIMKDFKMKYPKADITKFYIRDNKVYTHDPDYKISSKWHDMWLLGKKREESPLDMFHSTHGGLIVSKSDSAGEWPKIWTSGGKIPDFPKGKVHRNYNAFSWTSQDLYPYLYVIDYPVFNFRIYVNDKDYFMSKLPISSITSSKYHATWGDKLDYFQTIFGVYCSTFCCGVSKEHLTPSDDVHPIITSIMRFHFYFTTKRIIARVNNGEKMSAISREFNASGIYGRSKKIPWKFMFKPYKDSKGGVLVMSYKVLENSDYQHDYKMYVPQKSTGLQEMGQKYIQDCKKTRW